MTECETKRPTDNAYTKNLIPIFELLTEKERARLVYVMALREMETCRHDFKGCCYAATGAMEAIEAIFPELAFTASGGA